MPEQEQRERCSFCGKSRHQAPGMAALPPGAGPKAHTIAAVCTECLDLCEEIMGEQLT